MDPAGRYNQQINKAESLEKKSTASLPPKKSTQRGKDFEIIKNDNIFKRTFHKIAKEIGKIFHFNKSGAIESLPKESKNKEASRSRVEKLNLDSIDDDPKEISELNRNSSQQVSIAVEVNRVSSQIRVPSMSDIQQPKIEIDDSEISRKSSQETKEKGFEGLQSAYFKSIQNIQNLATHSFKEIQETSIEVFPHTVKAEENNDLAGREIPPLPTYIPPPPKDNQELITEFKAIVPTLTNAEAETLMKLKNHISEEKLLKLCKHSLMKNNKEMLMNTLKSIVTYLNTNSTKENDYFPKTNSDFGWSIKKSNKKGNEIFIRTPKILGVGGFKKVTESICLNNMKEYVSIAPRKKDFDGTLFAEKKLERNIVETKNEGERLNDLHEEGIPDIVPISKISYESKSKIEGKEILKTTYIAKKSPGDGSFYLDNVDADGNYIFDSSTIIPIMRDSLNALSHLHAKGYSHNDIKQENLLLKPKGGAYLSDFDGLGSSKEKKTLGISTSAFRPPEVHYGSSYLRSPKNDCYAAGVMFLEYLFGNSDMTQVFFENDDLRNKYFDYYINVALAIEIKKKYPNETIQEVQTNPKYQADLQKTTDKLQREFMDKTGVFEGTDLGRFFMDPENFMILIDDLSYEMMDRNLFGGDVEKQKTAIQILQGLLNPDLNERMTAAEAHTLISKLM